MPYYISTQTIEAAYRELTSVKYNNASILHIFFILKGIGINNLDYKNVDLIKNKGIPYTEEISSLFSDFERKPEKYEFINPFHMDDWGKKGANPSESLNKWVSTRIKNNVIGGATTWRKIIDQDNKDDCIKFKFDYINEVTNLTIGDNQRISLCALAIWANRFTVFDRKVLISEICDEFLERFNFNNEEEYAFFTTNSSIKEILFSEELYDTQHIRSLIGSPNQMVDWEISEPIISSDQIRLSESKIRRFSMGNSNEVSIELLRRILKDYNQLILTGPPGTSKSYLCNLLAKKYDKCVHVQFHPQYSYQEFIGGYIVDGSEVKYEKGIMLDVIESAIENSEEKYLIIIDEINRANTSQVFGDLIQCLDRNNTVDIICDGKRESVYLPKNIHIIGTMNSTDRTIGSLDYALKRRFLEVYCESSPKVLLDLCPNEDFISLSEFLSRINSRLYEHLKNKELCIGHAIFLNDEYRNEDGKYIWNFERFELIFNYRILPLVEEYCYGNEETVVEILSDKLVQRLSGERFVEAIREFMLS